MATRTGFQPVVRRFDPARPLLAAGVAWGAGPLIARLLPGLDIRHLRHRYCTTEGGANQRPECRGDFAILIFEAPPVNAAAPKNVGSQGSTNGAQTGQKVSEDESYFGYRGDVITDANHGLLPFAETRPANASMVAIIQIWTTA